MTRFLLQEPRRIRMAVSGDQRLPPHPVLSPWYRTQRERAGFVAELFDRSAAHYERICGAMSLGTGARYRRLALARAGLQRGMRLLDVASGTGLVARAALQLGLSGASVTGVDASSGMLRENRRIAPLPLALVQGMGEALPFADGAFDFVTLGYALRHVEDLRAASTEFHRVLRPGGTLLILEITRPRSRVGFALARLYLRQVIPAWTRLTTRSRDAADLMRYYWTTIEQCVPPAHVLAALAEVGFREARHRVSGGMLSEYAARK